MRLFLLYCTIALRNIRRHRRRSALTIGAVAFGIFCLVLFQALKQGLHAKMIASSLGLDLGVAQVHAAGYEPNMAVLHPIPAPEKALAALTSLDRPWAPRLKTPALILAGIRSSSVVLSGIDPAREPTVTFIRSRLTAGAYPSNEAPNLLIGDTLARTLDRAVGDTLDLLVQTSFGQTTTVRFVIGGIYRTGLASFDRSHVYLPITAVRRILETDANAVSEIAVGGPAKGARRLAADLASRLPDSEYQVRSFHELAPDLVQLMELNNATFALLVGIVFAIVALGIANTMTTVVFERFRELGTLAALGTTPAGIVGLIVTEAALLGLVAAALGTLAATAAGLYLSHVGVDLARFTSANQYFAAGTVLRAVLAWEDVAAANLIAVGTALAAGLYPAIRAARLDPVAALRAI